MPASSPPPIPMLDFSRQYAGLRQELLDAIAQACDSQHFILGPIVETFEIAAAQATASTHAIGCASGTDALWLALAAAGIGDSTFATHASSRPDAVITTPFTFFATASSILRAGARPLFADIDPRTFNLCPAAVAELLRTSAAADVRAILPVHLYGQCADWDAFESLIQSHPNIALIEDAAQAFGALWSSPGKPNRAAGSLGLAAAFSFYPTKNLAAMGDAGLVTTSDAAVATRLQSIRAHGSTRRYYHDEVGWNSRLDAIQAAILTVKLGHLPQWNQQRRTLAARYDRLFREAKLAPTSQPSSTAVATIQDGIVLPYTDPRATPVFHQYVIRAPRRDALRAHLTAHNIGSEIYYPVPLHLQAVLKDLGYKPGDFPQAERAAAEVLALPLYPELREDEQQRIVQTIRTFYA
ncbi:MAG TPA: DegT/DnrJ/EryC1/StrS family aminotransferase [Acidobacteriaceae bacterium]|nr:DegT/DnrJ/EryC1/StrS family aminotransferase [Acidobacteriaceae bacterium]